MMIQTIISMSVLNLISTRNVAVNFRGILTKIFKKFLSAKIFQKFYLLLNKQAQIIVWGETDDFGPTMSEF